MHPSHQSVVGNQGDQSTGPKNCFKSLLNLKKYFHFRPILVKVTKEFQRVINHETYIFSILSQPMFMKIIFITHIGSEGSEHLQGPLRDCRLCYVFNCSESPR